MFQSIQVDYNVFKSKEKNSKNLIITPAWFKITVQFLLQTRVVIYEFGKNLPEKEKTAVRAASLHNHQQKQHKQYKKQTNTKI